MIYLVDGHNLIPKIPWLSLEAEDDEMQLVNALQRFARLKRKKIRVFFDRAALLQPAVRKFGTITAHFAHRESSADQAIRQFLEKSGKESRNFCVVSSDRTVQNRARLHRAQVQSSEDFAAAMIETFREALSPPEEKDNVLSEEETARWLEIFNSSPDHPRRDRGS